MAELHVQPKRKSYWWLWLIILLIIIAAAVYWYMNYYNKNDNVVTDKVATVTNVDSANNEVQKNSMDDATAF